jgi:DNA-directed RNA polymerase specialized sigma24 family protein
MGGSLTMTTERPGVGAEGDGAAPRDSTALRDSTAFAAFVGEIEPRLRRAYVGWCGVDGAHDATAEALAWAWEHWSDVGGLANPAGYLYRVGQSRSRGRKQGLLPAPESLGLPEVEPGLVPALQALSAQQRTAVWLVHACGWTYAECAEAMEISASAVGTHVSRAMVALRATLEGTDG